MEVISIVLAAVLGLGIGSFLNVVIWRVPRKESIVRPPSSCPRCGNELKPWHNIPVLSWVFLRGRCAFCASRISARYPLVEGLTALVFAAATWHFGTSWVLPALGYFIAVGIALSFIDWDLKILPNSLVLPSYPVMLGLLALASWNPGGASDWSALGRGLVGALSLVLLYGAAWWFYPKGMGFGDVKLSGVIGLTLAWFGWGALAVGAFAGFLFGGIGSVILLSIAGKSRKSQVPFGPWMILGSWFGLAVGENIWRVYLDTFL